VVIFQGFTFENGGELFFTPLNLIWIAKLTLQVGSDYTTALLEGILGE
jgi:hypothetical protein